MLLELDGEDLRHVGGVAVAVLLVTVVLLLRTSQQRPAQGITGATACNAPTAPQYAHLCASQPWPE